MTKMNKYIMLAVVLMLALPAAAKNQWTVRGTAYDVDTIVYPHQVGPGVTYSRYDLPAYPLKVSVMEIDLNNPYIDLEAYLAKGTVLGVEDPLTTYNTFCDNGVQAVGAVNSDFCYTSPASEIGVPLSGHVTNSQMIVSPCGRMSFMFDDQRNSYMDAISFNGSITYNGEQHTLNSVNTISINYAPGATTGIFLFTDKWGGAYKYWIYGRMVLVSPKDGQFKWKPNGSETVVVDSVFNASPIEIPPGKALLWFRGDPVQLTSHMTPGEEIDIAFNVYLNGSPNLQANFKEMEGGSDILLARNGEIVGWSDDRHPRTCLGVTPDSTKLIFAVLDGRSTTSFGATLDEACQVMFALGAWDVLNLDGGGSSCMVVNGEVANRLSDGMVRNIGNGWIIKAISPVDDQIGIIDFAPRSFNLSCSSKLDFKIYGYNQYGVLLDKDLQGCTFSCDEQLGTFDDNGTFYAASLPATGKIYANYNGITCETDVLLMASEKRLRCDSVVIDRNHPYRIGVVAVSGLGEDNVDPAVMQWTIQDPTVCRLVDDGTLVAVADGRTEVYGAGEGFADTLVVRVENPKARITTIQGDEVIAENWRFNASGFKNGVVTALDNGLRVTCLGTSSRSPYVRLTLNPTLQLWGIPDTIRVRYRPGDADVTKVYLYTAPNSGQTINNTFTAPTDNVDGEYTINLPTADWVDAANLGVYPLSFSYVQFNVRTVTKDQEYVFEIPGLELIYNDGYPEMMRGDITGDNMVNGEDLNAMVNIILGNNAPADYYGQADVNGDGMFDAIDLNEIINIILKNAQ